DCRLPREHRPTTIAGADTDAAALTASPGMRHSFQEVVEDGSFWIVGTERLSRFSGLDGLGFGLGELLGIGPPRRRVVRRRLVLLGCGRWLGRRILGEHLHRLERSIRRGVPTTEGICPNLDLAGVRVERRELEGRAELK